METIQDESQNWSTDTLTDAQSLLLAITSPESVASLVITKQTLIYTTSITCNLQAEPRDIMEAVDDINTLSDGLQSVWDNVDDHHRDWFRNVEKMCREAGTEPSIPRRCSKQCNRANTPVQTACEYYKCILTIPYLTMFSVSSTPGLPPIRSRLSRDCVLCQLLLCPSLQMKPRRS